MSTLKVDTLQNSVGENLVFGNKNLLINGQMAIWQRSVSKTGITSVGYFTADRYNTGGQNLGTWTQSRSTDVPSGQGFSYSLKMDCTTADASPIAGGQKNIQQRLEGQNLQHILKGDSSNAKKLTLSFWVKSNKTGTYIAELYDEDNTRQISKSYTISSASTWEKKEITFDGDTSGVLDNDGNYSLGVVLWLGAGSDFTSGTLNTSWASVTSANRAVGQVNLADSTSNEWYVTGLMLEVGSKATDFEFEPYATTQRKCFRYAERLWQQPTDNMQMHRRNTSDNAWQGFINYKEPKRGEISLVELTAVSTSLGFGTANRIGLFNTSSWSTVTTSQSVTLSLYTSGANGTYYNDPAMSRGTTMRVNGVTGGTTGQLGSVEFKNVDCMLDAEL